MFRRNQRNRISVSSRSARRIMAAAERSQRKSNQLAMSLQRRANRISRWRREFSFLPLNFARFATVFSVLAGLLSYERTRIGLSRSGMVRWGGSRKSAPSKQSGRSKAKAAGAVTYQTLEDRALLASLVASQFAETTEFVDISSTGTALFGGTEDDATATFTSSVGNSFFPVGDIEVSTNGVLSSGPATTVDFTNEALPTNDFGTGVDQNILLPFWDDLDLDVADANVFWQELQIDGIDALVVQWEQISRFSTSPSEATFQVQIFDSEATPFRFVYQDTDFGRADSDFGVGATVGYQDSSDDFLQFSFNSPDSIPSNTVVSFAQASPVPTSPGIEFELANSSRGEDGGTGTVPTLLVGLNLLDTTPAQRTVNFSLTAGSATSGESDDFTLDLSFTIPEGDYSGAIERFDLTRFDSSGFEIGDPSFSDPVIEIFQDNLVEGTEAFSFNITNGLGIALNIADVNGDSQQRDGTNHFIVDDDLIRFTVNDATVTEGGTVDGTISVESSNDNGVTWVPGLASVTLLPGSEISFDLVDAGTGDAADPSDFSFTTQTYTILPGFTGDSLSFTLPTVDDSLVEGTETVDLSIQNVRSVTSGSTSDPLNTQVVTVDDTITILDNDTVVWNIAQDESSVSEGGDVTYTISLDGDGSGVGPFVLQSGDTASVSVSLNNLGTNGDDYSPLVDAINDAVAAFNGANAGGTPGTFTFVAGTLTWHGDGATVPNISFDLTAVDDALVEGEESYSINLSTPGGSVVPIPPTVTIGNSSVETLIVDNDQIVWNIAQSASTVIEGGSTTYTITLDGNGSATTGGPFVLQSGESTTVLLTLDDLGTDSGDYEALGAAVSSAVADFNGTNVAGAAGTFAYVAGQLTFFGDGETEPALDFTLETVNDSLVEGDESYSINLADPSGTVTPIPPTVTIGNATVTTLIQDNDQVELNLEASATEVDEGDSTDYTVTLVGSGSGDGPFVLQSGESASVRVALVDLGTNAADYEALESAIEDAIAAYNGASAEGDPNTFGYVANGSAGVLTYFGDSETSPELTFSIDAVDDNLIEGHEVYKIELTEPGGSVTPIPPTVTIGENSSVFTQINDNDSAVWTLVEDTDSLGQADSSNGLVDEGDTARYRLTLDGSGSASPGPAALQAGDTATIEISLTLLGTTSLNDLDEDTDQTVNESNPFGQAIIDAVDAYNAAAGTVSGQNNSFSVDPATWTVTYHGDGATTAPQLVIDLNTFDDTDASQGSGADEHVANLVEPDESFSVTIANPSDSVGATTPVISGSGTVETTIVNNDVATLAVESIGVFETSSTQTIQVSVTLDNPVAGGFTVDYETADITALVGDNDYVEASGTLTFVGTAGETQTISIDIIGDDVVEPDESFAVNLSNIVTSDPDIDPAAIQVAGGIVTGGTTATAGLTFLIDGDTFDEGFSITNSSSPGINVTAFQLDLSPIGFSFDTNSVTSDGSAGVAFAPRDGSDLTTGLTPEVVPDNATSFTLDFSDFQPGETFTWNIDVDATPGGDESVGGNDLIGATATIDFSDGTRLIGMLMPVDGNADAANFEVTEVTTVPDMSVGSGIVTILNDDIDLAIQPAAVAVQNEGDSGVTTFSFEVTRAGIITDSTAVTTVDWVVTPSGANGVEAADFVGGVFPSGTVTFGPGETSRTIEVQVLGEDLVEVDEDFTVTLSNAQNADPNLDTLQINVASQTATIVNDDSANITINDVTVQEADAGDTTTAQFTISIDQPADEDITVLVTTSDGTATTANNDYVSRSQTVTIPRGSATATFDVVVVGDDDVELDENFFVTLSDPTYNGIARDATTGGPGGILTGLYQVSIDDATGIGTINNEDALLEFRDTSTEQGEDGSVSPAPVFGAAAVGGPTLVVSGDLTGTTPESRVVTIQSFNGTALRNLDFNFGDNFLLEEDFVVPALDFSVNPGFFDLTLVNRFGAIATGVGADQPVLDITNDSIIEGPESLIVELQGRSNALQEGDADGDGDNLQDTTHIIVDDDTATISVVPSSILEEVGTQEFNVVLTTDNGLGGPAILGPGVNITVNVVDLLGANGGTAITPEDYSFTTQTVSFFSGQGSVPVTQVLEITANDDEIVEPDETVNIGFDNLAAGIATSQVVLATGDVTILDNDSGEVKFAVNDLTVNEDAGTVSVNVTVDAAVSGGFTVDYALVDVLADGQGVDFGVLGITSGTLSFTGVADETQQIVVPVIDDLTVEGLETFLVNLTNVTPLAADPASLTIQSGADSAIVGIADNDSPAIVSASITTVNESAGLATVTLTLNRAVQGGLSVDYATVDDSAVSGADFTAITGTANFAGAVNETVTFTVPIIEDNVLEATESLRIELSNATPGGIVSPDSIATIDGQITILDNELAVNVSASITTVDESAGTATVTLTLDNAVQDGFTVDYSTVSGTATVGSDFTATNGTATFVGTAGETVTFTVTIQDDAVVEGAESLAIQLSNVVPGGLVSASNIGTTNGSVTITDNDGPATVTASTTTVSESSVLVTLTLDQAVQGGFTVNYTTADGTAIAGSDYLTTSGVAAFNGTAGETITFVVPVINDNVGEPTEAFSILLSNVVPSGLVPASAINTVDGSVTILDDDGVTSVRASVTTVDEHAGTATVVLTLENAIQGGLTVDYSTADGTATAGLDYTATNGTASFVGNIGETFSFTVPINDDNVVEATEAFNIVLSNAVPLGIASAAGVNLIDGSVSITDNDEATVSLTPIGNDTVSEPNGVRAYTLALDGAASSTDTTVGFSTDGSALRFAGARADLVQDYSVWIDDGAGNFVDVTNGNTFTIPAGVGAVTVEIRVVDDVVVEFTENVDLRIVGTAGDDVVSGDPEITLGSSLGGVTNIIDNDQAQIVVKQLDAIAAETLETEPVNTAAFQVLVVVPGSVTDANPFGTPAPLAFDLDVGFGISDGTATNGVDFDSIDGEVSFGIGDTVRTVNVTPIDDALPELIETVVVSLNPFDVTTDTLGAPIADVAVVAGEHDEVTVAILDNDDVSLPAVVNVIRDGGNVSRPDLLTTLAVVFDRDVDITASALSLVNESLGRAAVDLTEISFSYDATTFTATWDFSTLAEPLSAAFYTATVDADAVTTAGSNITLARDFVHNEYVALVGDANLDGRVDVLGDAFILVSGLGASSGGTWQQGDFNGDGRVDVLGDAFPLVRNVGSSVLPPLGGASGFSFASSLSSSTASDGATYLPVSSSVVLQDDLEDESVDSSQNQQILASSTEAPTLAGSQSLDEAFASEDWLI